VNKLGCNVTHQKNTDHISIVMCRIQQEIGEVLGERTEVTYKDLEELQYIEQVRQNFPYHYEVHIILLILVRITRL